MVQADNYPALNIGSTRLMTDQDGKIIMEQDYLPFGGNLPKGGQVEVYNEIGWSLNTPDRTR